MFITKPFYLFTSQVQKPEKLKVLYIYLTKAVIYYNSPSLIRQLPSKTTPLIRPLPQ
jgi:hypothetical protein